jgi:hypothetical protein
VEISNDLTSWTPMAQQEVYDFTVEQGRFGATALRIRYPESQARYLRVRVSDPQGEPFEVASLSLSLTQNLLKNFGTGPNTAALRIARNDATIAERVLRCRCA